MAHIIIIEPDRILANIVKRGLEIENHSVVMCASAQAAIFAADEDKPDLVIAELQLIGHSGIEFLYEFRSYPEWQHIPVIIHTVVPPSEFCDSWTVLSGQLHASSYFYKPVTNFSTLARGVRLTLAAKVV